MKNNIYLQGGKTIGEALKTLSQAKNQLDPPSIALRMKRNREKVFLNNGEALIKASVTQLPGPIPENHKEQKRIQSNQVEMKESNRFEMNLKDSNSSSRQLRLLKDSNDIGSHSQRNDLILRKIKVQNKLENTQQLRNSLQQARINNVQNIQNQIIISQGSQIPLQNFKEKRNDSFGLGNIIQIQMNENQNKGFDSLEMTGNLNSSQNIKKKSEYKFRTPERSSLQSKMPRIPRQVEVKLENEKNRYKGNQLNRGVNREQHVSNRSLSQIVQYGQEEEKEGSNPRAIYGLQQESQSLDISSYKQKKSQLPNIYSDQTSLNQQLQIKMQQMQQQLSQIQQQQQQIVSSLSKSDPNSHRFLGLNTSGHNSSLKKGMPLSETSEQVYQNNRKDYFLDFHSETVSNNSNANKSNFKIDKQSFSSYQKQSKPQVNYKMHSFKDFMEMQQKAASYKPGGLGANIGGENWEKGHRRLKLINSYEQSLKERKVSKSKSKAQEKENLMEIEEVEDEYNHHTFSQKQFEKISVDRKQQQAQKPPNFYQRYDDYEEKDEDFIRS